MHNFSNFKGSSDFLNRQNYSRVSNKKKLPLKRRRDGFFLGQKALKKTTKSALKSSF
jgi:hypothetical protein